jgi:hypothetical protein
MAENLLELFLDQNFTFFASLLRTHLNWQDQKQTKLAAMLNLEVILDVSASPV